MRIVMLILHIYILCTLVLFHNFHLCISACGKDKYEVNGECCPMCGAGQGLRIKTECTFIADTICEPCEGFYCNDQHSCRAAAEHSKCKPGQYIRQKGTADTNTVCGDCVGETYSNGSFSSCLPHTHCENSMGYLRWVKRPGTPSSDTECGETHLAAIIFGVLFGIIILVGSGLFYFCWYKKRKSVLSEESSPKTDADDVESQSTRMLDKEKHLHPQSHTAIRQEPEEDAPEDQELNGRNGQSGYELTAVNSKDSRRNHWCSPAHPSEDVSFRNQETETSL